MDIGSNKASSSSITMPVSRVDLPPIHEMLESKEAH